MTQDPSSLPGDFVAPHLLPERRREPRDHVPPPRPDTPTPAPQIPPPPAPASEIGPDQRDNPRSPTALPLQAILLDVPGHPTVPIKCADTSRSGLGFYSHHAFQPGERFALRFHFANTRDRLVLCQVRHCRHLAANWHQGGVAFLDAVTLSTPQTILPHAWTHPPSADSTP